MKAVLFLLAALFLTACGQSEAEKEKYEVITLEKFTPAQLMFMYEQNTVAADANLKGKRYKVYGQIKSIETNINSEPYVMLGQEGDTLGPFPMFFFRPGLEASIAPLVKNQLITLDCVGGGDILKVAISKKCKLSLG